MAALTTAWDVASKEVQSVAASEASDAAESKGDELSSSIDEQRQRIDELEWRQSYP